MEMVSLEQFKKDMEWSTLEFTEVQLERIYATVNVEYASFGQLTQEVGDMEDDSDTVTYFSDCALSEAVGYLNDLGDCDIITNVLTLPYGHNGTSATLYYLNEDAMYCLVI